MEPTAECAQLHLGFVDQMQWRYEVIRPLVLFADRTAQQRAQETETHPDTVRTLQRRFRQQGMLSLLPADVEVIPRRRASPIPEMVLEMLRDELDATMRMCGRTTVASVNLSRRRGGQLAAPHRIQFDAPTCHVEVQRLIF